MPEALRPEREEYGPQALNTPQEKLGEKNVPNQDEIDVDFDTETDALLKELGVEVSVTDQALLDLEPSDVKDEKYHTAASKVYEIANQFERDKSPLNDEQKKSLQTTKDWMPGFISDEQKVSGAIRQNLSKLNSALSQVPDESKNRVQDRIDILQSELEDSEVRLRDLRVFDRYVGMLFVENNNRIEGKAVSAPKLQEAVEDEAEEPKKSKSKELLDAVGYQAELETTFPQLRELTSIVDNFSIDPTGLKSNYFDSGILTERSPGNTRIDAMISKISTDVSKVDALSTLLEGHIAGFAFQNHADHVQREKYIRSDLLPKLRRLKSSLQEKSKPYQDKKDEVVKPDIDREIDTRPEIRRLTRALDQVDQTNLFTNIDQFSQLRQEILTAQSVVQAGEFITTLLKSKGVSDLAIARIKQEVQTKYLARVDGKLNTLDQNTYGYWKDRFLENTSTASEYKKLADSLAESGNPRSTAAECMVMRSKLRMASEAVSQGVQDRYLEKLPVSKRAEGQGLLRDKLSQSEPIQARLLNEARTKVIVEINANSLVDRVRQATIAGGSPGDANNIRVLETELSGALAQLNTSAIVDSFDVELHTTAVAELEKITSAANKRQLELTTKKSELEKDVVDRKREKLSLAIQDILNLNDNSAWVKTIAELEGYEAALNAEIALAAQPPGYNLDSNTYQQARENISKYIKEKRDLSEDSMHAIISNLEDGNVSFVDNHELWNDWTARMQRLATRDSGLHGELEVEVAARSNLHTTWDMVETAFAEGKLIDNLKPSAVILKAAQIGYLFKYKQVAKAWRAFDDIWETKPIIDGVQVSAANFESSKDKIKKHVADLVGDPTSAEIAYRLQTVFFRPSEYDKIQAWTGKDEVRQVMHITDYREKYAGKGRASGPEITIHGFFNKRSSVDTTGRDKDKESHEPVIYMPDAPSAYDPGWDLFPGFLHFAYEGDVEVGSEGSYKKTPTDRGSDGKIKDFSSYRTTDNKLAVESMPWERLETDVLRSYMIQFKTTGYKIHNMLLESPHDANKMKNQEYFKSIMSTWQYLEPHIFKLRDYTTGEKKRVGLSPRDQVAEDERVAERTAVGKAYMERFRAMWLLGVMDNNFNKQYEGSGNWNTDQLDMVLRSAVDSKFITKESSAWIKKNAKVWSRRMLGVVESTADKLQKSVFEIESK